MHQVRCLHSLGSNITPRGSRSSLPFATDRSFSVLHAILVSDMGVSASRRPSKVRHCTLWPGCGCHLLQLCLQLRREETSAPQDTQQHVLPWQSGSLGSGAAGKPPCKSSGIPCSVWPALTLPSAAKRSFSSSMAYIVPAQRELPLTAGTQPTVVCEVTDGWWEKQRNKGTALG